MNIRPIETKISNKQPRRVVFGCGKLLRLMEYYFNRELSVKFAGDNRQVRNSLGMFQMRPWQ